MAPTDLTKCEDTDRSGKTVSLWMTTANMPEGRPLDSDTRADVCIVGGGIAGLSTAYLLAREGRSVAVIERGSVGGGMTGRTTAHLSNEIDDRYTEIERLHGKNGARLAAESHTAAIDQYESICRDENIDCDFERVDGYLFLAPEHSEQMLDEELQAARRAGLTNVTKIERAPLPSFDTGPCLQFPQQGQIHALKFLAGLAAAIERRGGRIVTHTRAEGVESEKDRPARVKLAGGKTVTADHVVIATNSPVIDRLVLHTKQYPYATYVIGARVPYGSIPRGLYWDTLDPYHYVRLQAVEKTGTDATPEYDVLIVGGEDHKTAQAKNMAEQFDKLEAWTRQRFPMVQSIESRWSGQVQETFDGLAFIGHNPLDTPNVYVATGDSGMGMTHGMIAGILLTDLIQGRENPWKSIYEPNRKTTGSFTEFAKENLNVATEYADWLMPGEVKSIDEIAPGSGAVIREGLRKIAVYRDEQGVLHRRSATCVHLGCVVGWNDVEHTWDCPCHGSRFDKVGKAIVGPANTDLSSVDS